MQRQDRTLFLVAAGIWLLSAAGAFLPGPFTWGFHALSYLPLPLRLLFLAAGAAAILLLRSERTGARVDTLLAAADARPLPALAAAIGAFVALALLLRVAVPLLGDSFIAVKLYENRSAGPPFLPNSHYPAAFFYFFMVMRAMGAFTYPAIMNAFLAGEILLGAGFLAALWYLSRSLFDDARTRVAAFLLLALLPATQVFLGYAEIYAASLCLLAAYLLAAALFLRREAPFAVVAVAFLFLVLAHYLNLLLAPSLLYLGAIAYRRDGPAALGIGAGAVAAAALLLLSLSGIAPSSLLPAPRHTPFLSVGAAEDLYQAYPLFSAGHAIDLLNLAALAAPAGLALLLLGLRDAPFTARPAAIFLASAGLPVAAFVVAAKFDLPMAQDWDIPSPYALVVTLLGLVLLRGTAVRGLTALVAVTAMTSLGYFTLNASAEASVARAATFIDPRVSSQDGAYQSTLHFVEYYLSRDEPEQANVAFDRFLALYPTDPRGYANYTLHLMQFGRGKDVRIRELFERWMAVDGTGEARARFADFCLDIGHRDYKAGALAAARDHFAEALRFNPAMPEAYNGLGVIARRSGDIDGAIALYEKAAALDSVNAYAFINLGNLYDDRGAPDRAIAYYQRAIAIDPRAAEAYFNMGVTYARRGDTVRSVDAVKAAARLGHADAQALLRSRGEQW